MFLFIFLLAFLFLLFLCTSYNFHTSTHDQPRNEKLRVELCSAILQYIDMQKTKCKFYFRRICPFIFGMILVSFPPMCIFDVTVCVQLKLIMIVQYLSKCCEILATVKKKSLLTVSFIVDVVSFSEQKWSSV